MAFEIEFDNGLVVPLAGSTVRIGTAASCEAVLPTGSGLAERHAAIKRVGDRWMIEALSDRDIELIGQSNARIHWLTIGDRLRLAPAGPCFTFRESQQRNRPAQVKSPPRSRQEQQPERRPASKPAEASASVWALKPLAIVAAVATIIALAAVVVLFRSKQVDRRPDLVEVSTPATNSGSESSSRPASKETPPPSAPSGDLDADSLKRIVWIGVETEGGTFALGNAWLVDATTLVAPAGFITALRASGQLSTGLFVDGDEIDRRPLKLQDFRNHPKFVDSDQSPSSGHYDLCAIRFTEPLDKSLTPARLELSNAKSFRDGERVTIVTCEFGGLDQPITKVNEPTRIQTVGTILSTQAIPGDADAFPKLRVSFAGNDRVDGSAVLSADGQTIALIVGHVKDYAIALPVDRLKDLVVQ